MAGRNNSMEQIISVAVFTIVLLITSVQGMLQYPPRYQPELDQLSLEKYITDDYLFNMHINCLLYDGPCDPVGRWMKPRMASYFLSSCILCTPNQEKEADKFMTWLHEHHPQLFRIGIGKYLDANGITLPSKSKFREQVQKMNVPKVAISSTESETKEEEKVGSGNTVSVPLSPGGTPTSDGELGQKPERSSQDQDEDVSQPTKSQNKEDESGGPSERVLNSNARKNKFSSAMSYSHPAGRTSGSSFGPVTTTNKFNQFKAPIGMEDDEAEMDFKFYHN